jgi:hypothetical protein
MQVVFLERTKPLMLLSHATHEKLFDVTTHSTVETR